MITPVPTAPAAQKTYAFGFARQMRDADWSQFPSWYRTRCLLAPVMLTPSRTAPQSLRSAA